MYRNSRYILISVRLLYFVICSFLKIQNNASSFPPKPTASQQCGAFIFMIAKIPLSQRPVFTCTKENWLRNIEPISSDGEYIYYHDEKIGFDDLVNLTSTVGAVAYAYKKDDVWLIFDFSSSHLCHKQIKAAILELLCNYS